MDDLGFVQKCATGDKQSWDAFVEKYSRLIYSAIHSVLKSSTQATLKENIDDLFQEVFLSLTRDNFKKLRSFQARNGCRLGTWLRTVSINLVLDHLRREKPGISLEDEDTEGHRLKDILSDTKEPIPETAIRREKLRGLEDCIKILDSDEQYFLELCLNQGCSVQELAEHLGIKRGAVDMRRHRLIERLRECFRKKGFGLDF
jgi:RNA polymerase sigma-70 factor (ECF subfamily)